MLVSKKHKKLILNLKDHERVTTLIPSARTITYKGRTLVAVPHRLDEVRVLRNLGLDAPAPMGSYYDWPGRYKPYAHQKVSAEFLTMNPRAFLLNGMGSGKSVTTLWAFDYLKKAGLIKRMLIISPLSTLERAWGDEIFRHFPELSFCVLHGSREKRHKLIANDFDIYIINHDGIKSADTLKLLATKEGLDLVVIDEIAVFRTPGTDRFKALNTLVNGNEKAGFPVKKWAWGLTGTPIPNAPTDAWAQIRIISPSRVPRYFGAFRDAVMRQITQFKWAGREGALEQVHAVMQPAIRFAREDCIDLPPTTYMTRQCELSPEQKAAFDAMVKQLKAEVAGGQITALNEAVKLSKLLQICCLRYDTPVLTHRGWVPIIDVTPSDTVWDGVEWVRHSGSMYMGDKAVIESGGVFLTPDHSVLTTSGWKTAQEVNDGKPGNRLKWAEVRLPDSFAEARDVYGEMQKSHVVVPVRLRAGCGSGEPELAVQEPTQCETLRLPTRGAHHDPRNGTDPTLRHLGEHAPALRRPDGQGLGELRRARHFSVPRMAGLLRDLLARHAPKILGQSHSRSEKQRRWVRPDQLRVGNADGAGQQQTEQRLGLNTAGCDDTQPGSPARRDGARHADCQDTALRVELGKSDVRTCVPVYDLANCGPRSRFVVQGQNGELRIVHNCGVAYSEGAELVLPAGPRIALLKEIIEESEAKVLVFVPFTGALKAVAAELSKDYTVATVYGATSKTERDQIFKDFQQAKDPHVLVCQAKTMSHGLSFTAASTTIWYGPTTSNETYMQANERTARPGQKLNTLIVNIESTPLERKMYDRLASKGKTQGILLDMLKGA